MGMVVVAADGGIAERIRNKLAHFGTPAQLVRERRGAERKREALREEVAELRAALVVARDAVAAGAA